MIVNNKTYNFNATFVPPKISKNFNNNIKIDNDLKRTKRSTDDDDEALLNAAEQVSLRLLVRLVLIIIIILLCFAYVMLKKCLKKLFLNDYEKNMSDRETIISGNE